MEWILASASPRRKELFAEVVKEFEIIPAKGEEKVYETLSPASLVQTLAMQKAMEIGQTAPKGKWILGADTVVALNGEILGKPKDKEDAARMLCALSGKTHEVLTGVCILFVGEEVEIKRAGAVATKVVFENLTREWIEKYIESGSPMDKAGAYGIQDGGLVKEIQGSYSNVVGLPMEQVREWIQELSK